MCLQDVQQMLHAEGGLRMNSYPRTPEACINSWVKYLEDRGYLESTILNYRSTATVLVNCMKEIDVDPLPYMWTKEDVQTMIEHWEDKNLRVKTQTGYHFVMCRFAADFDNFAPSSVAVKWPDEETIIRWLTLNQAKIVLNTPMTEMQRLGIELMLRMGRRRIEGVRAQLSDMIYDAPDPYMIVDGKGHKKHKMPFAPTTDKILSKWLDVRSDMIREYVPKHKQDEITDLFVYRKGEKVNGFSTKRCTGWDSAITNDVSCRSGVYFSNHDLRRTFGRELYFTAKIDIKLIKSYYNHSTIEQTEKYIGADISRMSDGMKNMPF